MKSIFVDTNIIIDFFTARENFGENSRKIFKMAESKKAKLFCSSHAVATTHYVVRKFYAEQVVREKIALLLDFIKVIAIDEEIIKKSLKSQHKDFEDAFQIFCAHQIKNIDCIVTRNIKDFSTSEIPVFAPDELLNLTD